MNETGKHTVLLGGDRTFFESVCTKIDENKVTPLAILTELKNTEAMLRCLSPKVIVIDDSFASIKAPEIIHRINCYDISSDPAIIVVSDKNDTSYIELCMNRGATYYMLKPVPAEILWERIDMFYIEKKECGTELKIREKEGGITSQEDLINRKVVELLYFTGCSPKLKGFTFLKEAIANEIKNPKQYSSCRQLYKEIGAKYNQSWFNIERNVGIAVKSINTVGTIKLFEKLYGNIIYYKENITALEFITLAANAISTRRTEMQGG